MSASDPVVIVGMSRTPMGAMLGELAGFSANELVVASCFVTGY